MQEKKSIKYLFVVNPGSGRNSADSWNTVINDYFKQTGENFEIYIHDLSLENLKKEFIEHKNKYFIQTHCDRIFPKNIYS